MRNTEKQKKVNTIKEEILLALDAWKEETSKLDKSSLAEKKAKIQAIQSLIKLLSSVTVDNREQLKALQELTAKYSKKGNLLVEGQKQGEKLEFANEINLTNDKGKIKEKMRKFREFAEELDKKGFLTRGLEIKGTKKSESSKTAKLVLDGISKISEYYEKH